MCLGVGEVKEGGQDSRRAMSMEISLLNYLKQERQYN